LSREGRIHRFKGHAIRKNLAANYDLSEVSGDDVDPWEALSEPESVTEKMDLAIWFHSGYTQKAKLGSRDTFQHCH
jgi:hypothetical protein